MSITHSMKQKLIIGRRDIVDFPELNLNNIEIKMDTGAYTSSIHCHHIEEKIMDGQKVIRFELLDPTHPQYNNKEFLTKNYKIKRIKNSFGSTEKRYIINTNIKIFNKIYPIELSLSERGEMKYPVLIGRKLIRGKFIVDPSKADLSHTNSVIKVFYQSVK